MSLWPFFIKTRNLKEPRIIKSYLNLNNTYNYKKAYMMTTKKIRPLIYVLRSSACLQANGELKNGAPWLENFKPDIITRGYDCKKKRGHFTIISLKI